jgi:hypothetical protein
VQFACVAVACKAGGSHIISVCQSAVLTVFCRSASTPGSSVSAVGPNGIVLQLVWHACRGGWRMVKAPGET